MRVVNAHGVGRLQLNVLVLQQNLKNIERDVSLSRAAKFWDLWAEGADKVLEWAKGEKDSETNGEINAGEGEGKNGGREENFTYEELKSLLELCYSEQLNSPERGISTVAKRGMGEHLLQLSEYMWQS